MRESLSQTLTFLFTDLEGSTRLWEEQPDAMRAALALHDRVLRDEVEAHKGTVVKSTGDGVLATFTSALDGVAAATTGQRALLGAAWPSDVDLRVRMGVHIGEATERDGDWFGSDVNRAARVTAAAHGGQILCTAAVADRVGDYAPLLDLGAHRLRDLQSEVQLFQVVGDGLPVSFPPLRTLDAYRSNLPYELSSFVGRDTEIREVAERVRAARLVTIVGVGGVGKTRLALQVASEVLPHFADGVWLCELASVRDPDAIADAVAAALGYAAPQGVTVQDGLPRFLERKDLLLVLDNCEHLVRPLAGFVTRIAASAAHVSVLATSREALGVRGEHTYPLASLAMPDAPDAVAVLASEAGALFVARAAEARGDLALGDAEALAVHDVCERLDGIPLAIELAAARTNVMSVTEVLTRLDHQFRLLTGGRGASLERHQTLRAAIEWSYELLDDDERALFARLSVCIGGFDLDAAAALATGIGLDEFDAFDLLAALVSKSLVERTERGGTTRYRQLEMIRQYAAEQLMAIGMADAARDDHARHYLTLATRLFDEASTAATNEPLERLDLETPNIGAAGQWLLASGGIEQLLVFFERLPFLDPFSIPVALVDELGAVASDAAHAPGAEGARGMPNACFFAGFAPFFAGDRARFRVLAERALASEHGATSPMAAVMVATVALFDGDLDALIAHAERAVELARISGGVPQFVWMLAYLGSMRSLVEPGLHETDEAVALARTTGGTVIRLYPLLSFAGSARRVAPARALDAAEELIEIDPTRRRTFTTSSRGLAAEVRLARGDVADALHLWSDVLREMAANGERTLFTVSLSSLAGAVATYYADAAIELAAICDSDAIAHMATFTMNAELVHLVEQRPGDVAHARDAAAELSYEQAVARVFAVLDGLIAEHRSSQC